MLVPDAGTRDALVLWLFDELEGGEKEAHAGMFMIIDRLVYGRLHGKMSRSERVRLKAPS